MTRVSRIRVGMLSGLIAAILLFRVFSWMSIWLVSILPSIFMIVIITMTLLSIGIVSRRVLVVFTRVSSLMARKIIREALMITLIVIMIVVLLLTHSIVIETEVISLRVLAIGIRPCKILSQVARPSSHLGAEVSHALAEIA